MDRSRQAHLFILGFSAQAVLSKIYDTRQFHVQYYKPENSQFNGNILSVNVRTAMGILTKKGRHQVCICSGTTLGLRLFFWGLVYGSLNGGNKSLEQWFPTFSAVSHKKHFQIIMRYTHHI